MTLDEKTFVKVVTDAITDMKGEIENDIYNRVNGLVVREFNQLLNDVTYSTIQNIVETEVRKRVQVNVRLKGE